MALRLYDTMSREVRDVFGETSIALHHAVVADPDELVEHGSAADVGMVAHLDVAGQ